MTVNSLSHFPLWAIVISKFSCSFFSDSSISRCLMVACPSIVMSIPFKELISWRVINAQLHIQELKRLQEHYVNL